MNTIYTCPMHPEVTTDQPGKCPKCGMTLEPKKQSPEAHGHTHAHFYFFPPTHLA